MKSLLLIFLALPLPVHAQKILGSMECTFTGTDFVYDCRVTLARGGKPLEGVRISVGADMPSMPMAHNIKPVVAKPGKAPGEYEARLDLDMIGEWAIKLRLSGPVRDQLVLLYQFDERGASPLRDERGARPAARK
ncbi:MAG TPA: FixH family protein [Burkholderiales bacterium]|nr:FixH family protein [Burkholderiales bacterium]